MNQLILAIILSFLPISELRGGMPLAITYALKNSIQIFPIFLLIVFSNILAIFVLFFFLDFLNDKLLKIKAYKKFFDYYLEKTRKKADKLNKKMSSLGYFALAIFVAIPLPMTGAWTGTFIAWFLGLERKKSILAIALGVLIAGLIVLFATLGIIKLF
jgi:uncharacterized membrane protein